MSETTRWNDQQKSEGLEMDTADIAADLAALRADLAKVTQTLTDMAASRAADAADTIQDAAHRGLAKARDTADTLLLEAAERPVTTASGIFILGVIVGLMCGRR
jgi:hypothetical protein